MNEWIQSVSKKTKKILKSVHETFQRIDYSWNITPKFLWKRFWELHNDLISEIWLLSLGSSNVEPLHQLFNTER